MVIALSMNDQKGASSIALAVATVVAGASLYYLANRDDSSKQKIHGKPTVPYASPGIVESIREFSGEKCPEFMLSLVQEAKQNGSVDGSYRLPLSVGGLYVIASAKVCREILLDPTSDKIPQFYHPYNEVTGTKASIFTSVNSEYQTMVRRVGSAMTGHFQRSLVCIFFFEKTSLRSQPALTITLKLFLLFDCIHPGEKVHSPCFFD